jgi:hypothetical protein
LRRAEINLKLNRFEEANSDATNAVAMHNRVVSPGMQSCNLGLAYLALGRAYRRRPIGRGRASVRIGAGANARQPSDRSIRGCRRRNGSRIPGLRTANRLRLTGCDGLQRADCGANCTPRQTLEPCVAP